MCGRPLLLGISALLALASRVEAQQPTPQLRVGQLPADMNLDGRLEEPV